MRITPKYTSTKDETLGNKLGTIASVEDAATVIPVGIMLSSTLATVSRIISTADTELSLQVFIDGIDPLVVENYPALVLYGKFDTVDAAATVYLIYYDSNDGYDVPLFFSGPYVLASSDWRMGIDDAEHVSNRFLVDTCGASKIYAYVSSLTTSAAVTVYLGTLSG